MRRFLPLSVPISLLVAACPAVARAHELQVVPVGSAELDAGRGDPARLVHATLDEPGDELVVTLRATGAPLELLLLVPDRRPERGFGAGELPTLSVGPAAGGTPIAVGGPEGGSEGGLVDEATALEYRVFESRTLGPPSGTPVRVRVRRGSEPSRVALRVGVPGSFEAANVENTPRNLVRVRAWSETPAPSARMDRTPAETTSRPVAAWFGAGIALAGVLVAAWWVGAGHRRSRIRGAERRGAP